MKTEKQLIKAAKHYGAMLGMLQNNNSTGANKHQTKARKIMINTLHEN